MLSRFGGQTDEPEDAEFLSPGLSTTIPLALSPWLTAASVQPVHALTNHNFALDRSTMDQGSRGFDDGYDPGWPQPAVGAGVAGGREGVRARTDCGLPQIPARSQRR